MGRLIRLAALCCACCCFLAVTVTEVRAERRIGLVIGNNIYDEIPVPLERAINDAEAVGETLSRIGFDVQVLRDAGRRRINAAIAAVARQVGPGDTVVFFYAGHGVEIAGRNFLLPSDIPNPLDSNEDLVAAEAIPLALTIERLKATGATTIAVIDACRDNPLRRRGTRSIGGEVGLGRIAPPEGSFVIFSAGAGQEALDILDDDDAHPNSVFTRNLLPLLETPGLDIRDLAFEVRRKVADLAATVDFKQTPAYYDELLGRFSFVPAVDVVKPEPVGLLAAVDPEPEPLSKATGARGGARVPPAPVEPGSAEGADRRAGSDPVDATLDPAPASSPSGPDEAQLEAPELSEDNADPQLAARMPAPDPVPGGERRDAAAATAPAQAEVTDPETQPGAAQEANADPQVRTEADLDADERRAVQRRLQRLGFDPGVVDGIIGPNTRRAIRGWQRAMSRPVTGRLTPEEIARLLPTLADFSRATGAAWPPGQAGFQAATGQGAAPDPTGSAASTAPWPPRQETRPPRSEFRDPGSGRYVDAQGCAREADGRLIFCP
ncbi:MAG: caspase family protein [Pikeienuella sp.]